MPPSVKITNHYDKKTGGLTVSKTVVGGDKAKAFNFTVTLDDKTISGTYGGMTFEKGVATFQLKDGEEKKADGLPFGTGYEVTEAPAAGYTQAVTGEKGAIVPDSTLTAAFINTYGTKAASVALGGEKTLQGYPDNAKKPTFRFVLKDKEKTIGTATTEGQGNFTFDTLTFEKEGTYEYTGRHHIRPDRIHGDGHSDGRQGRPADRKSGREGSEREGSGHRRAEFHQ